MLEQAVTLSITDKNKVHFRCILLGVGGTGGYVLRSLVRMIHSYQAVKPYWFSLTICDGDSVESKNVLRQDFIDSDVHKKKVDVLAERFSNAYGITIAKRDSYVENLDSIKALCRSGETNERYGIVHEQLVIIGCVDNNATRQLVHQFFEQERDVIYIDAGNDSIITKDDDSELSEEEQMEIEQSGYSGQVVIGWKRNGKIILPPVGFLYPDILDDKETFFPSQSCGLAIVDNPQRRVTNELSAMVVTSYLNNLFGSLQIHSHQTTFNAQTMTVRPSLITESYLAYLKERKQGKQAS